VQATADAPVIVPSPQYTTALVPPDEAFPGKSKFLKGNTKGFEDLQQLIADLIEKYPIRFQGLEQFDFDAFWQRAGGKVGGRPAISTTQRLSGSTTAYTTSHYRINVAADLVRAYEFTRADLEKQLYHALCYCDITDARGHKLKRPDTLVFLAEVEDLGLWTMDLKAIAPAFEQARLI
jgi:hypothetical protein